MQAVQARNLTGPSPTTSPPSYAMSLAPGVAYPAPVRPEFEEMHVLAQAAAQQLEQERARGESASTSSSGTSTPHPPSRSPSSSVTSSARSGSLPGDLRGGFSHGSHGPSHLNPNHQQGYHHSYHPSPAGHLHGGAGSGYTSPYNRPSLSMSRQHSQDEDDSWRYGTDVHRSKRSRPGSPVCSTAPASPLHSPRAHTPTPEHTPLVTPSHSPRLHPRELDAANGVHLPTLRNLNIRPTPPALAALEVDPFQPGSGYSTPKHTGSHQQAPVNAMRLSDILESHANDHDARTLPVPCSDNASTRPNSGPGSRSASHTNLRDLAR